MTTESADKGKRENKDFIEKREIVGFSDEALKKCLEERKGEKTVICKAIIEAFNKSSSSSSSTEKPRRKLVLRSGRLTDV